MKKILSIAGAVSALIIILSLPCPSVSSGPEAHAALTPTGKAALGVLAMSVILWVTEALPFPVTGLCAVLLLSATGAVEFRSVVKEGFGNEIVLFLIGVLIFAVAINRTGLLQRLTSCLLAHLGRRPEKIILVFLVVGALMGMWITNMAAVAMLVPVGFGVLRCADVEKNRSNFGRALMIACVWGPLIGSVATPAGSVSNPLTIGYLRDLAGVDISFGQWMLVGLPAACLMIPCAWVILLKGCPIEPEVAMKVSARQPSAEGAMSGRFQLKDGMTLTALILAVLLWVGKPLLDNWTHGATHFMSISFVAIACACLLFLPRVNVIEWRDAQREIDWGAIVLVMTGLSLGYAVYQTGAAQWLALIAFGKIGAVHAAGQVFLVVMGESLLKIVLSSNTVTGVIVVPLLIGLAKEIHVHPALLAIPAGIASSLAFILVTSSPAGIIAYSSGCFSIWDMAKVGIWMTLVAAVCVTISMVLMGPICHIPVLG